MTIERAENPATGEEIVIAKGVVAQISFKPMPNGKDQFENTHRAGVKIGEDWINNINLKVKEGNDPQIRFNNGTQGKPDWQTLDVGDEVRITCTESEYNGKIYYYSGTSKIKLVKKGAGGGSSAAGKPAQAGGNTYTKRDTSGVEIGHAVNGGYNLQRGGVEGDIVDLAKQVHDLTVALKAEYAKKNPDMSDYDVGASVGHAVLNGTRDGESIERVEEIARSILDEVVPAVAEYVRGGKKEAEKPKPAAKKAPAKKAANRPVPQPDPVQDDGPGDDDSPPWNDDSDDDIPF